jgi:hypothetical protein
VPRGGTRHTTDVRLSASAAVLGLDGSYVAAGHGIRLGHRHQRAALGTPARRQDQPRVHPRHLAAPLTVAALSVVLFVESAWLGVPLTQSLAVVAHVMAGSTLLPIKPLDGANVGKAGFLAAAGVVGGAVLIALGII